MAVFDREHYFRDLLAKQVGGRTEVTLPFGRADVMTDTMVWEVEPASRYPAGVRQALHYGAMSGRPAAIATYGPRKLVTKVFGHLAKLPAPGVELWWLHERRFVPVKSASEADAFAKLPNHYRLPNGVSAPMPCEVTWQDGEVMRSCDAEPATWEPIRLCQEHLDQASPCEAPIVGPVSRDHFRDNPNGWWTAASDLKAAEDLVLALKRLAWPHLDPDSRDLIAAYLTEVRSVIWGCAIRQPGYAKAWGDEEDDGAPMYPDLDTRLPKT